MPAPCLAHPGVVFGLVTGLLLISAGAQASDEARRFDISSQPLGSALVEFADRTGMAALIDAELASGKQSTVVRGRLTPQDALRILLAGTGLSFRRAGDSAFTVIAGAGEGDVRGAQRHHTEHDAYFLRMQSMIRRALCEQPDIRAGAFRSVFQIWVGQGGAVDAVHAVGSTGDAARDTRIAEAIERTRVTPPPAGIPQPVTIVLQQSQTDAMCTVAAAR